MALTPNTTTAQPTLTSEADSLFGRLQGILDNVRSISYKVHGTEQADRVAQGGNHSTVMPVSPISDSVTAAHKVISDIQTELGSILSKL